MAFKRESQSNSLTGGFSSLWFIISCEHAVLSEGWTDNASFINQLVKVSHIITIEQLVASYLVIVSAWHLVLRTSLMFGQPYIVVFLSSDKHTYCKSLIVIHSSALNVNVVFVHV